MRRETAAIRQPARDQASVTILESQRVLIARRQTEGQAVFLCWNFGDSPLNLADLIPSEIAWRVLLDSSEPRWVTGDHVEETTSPRPAPAIVRPKSCVLLAS